MKKILPFVLIMCMLCTLFAVPFTVSASSTVVDGFEVKNFTTTGDLATGGDITVNVELQKVGASAPEFATVVAAVYKNGIYSDGAIDTKSYDFIGAIGEYSLSVTALENSVLRIFLWDGISLKPLAKSSDNASVVGIMVDGKAIEDFDVDTTSYTVNAYASASAQPSIKVLADGIIGSSVTWNENVATVVANGKTYTITYHRAEPALEGLSFTRLSNGTNYKVGTTWTNKTGNVKMPTFATGDVIPLPADIDSKGDQTILKAFDAADEADLANKVTPVYSNPAYKSTWFYDVLPADFSTPGMKYLAYFYSNGDEIPTGNGDNGYGEGMANGGTVYPGDDTIEFKTNKSVRIYYQYIPYYGYYDADATKLVEFGNENDGTSQYKFSRTHIDSGSTATTTVSSAFAVQSSSHPTREFKCWMAWKDVVVPAGTEFVTASIKFHTDTVWEWAPIFYEFIDAENLPSLGGAFSANPAETSSVAAASFNDNDGYTYTLAEGKLAVDKVVAGLDTQKELFNDGQGNYSKTLNSVFGCTTNSALDDYVTNTVSNFANYGWFYMTMPNKFVGKNIITLPYGDNGNSVAFASNDQITLTVTKNTRIYVSTDEDWLTPGGKLFGTFDFAFAGIDNPCNSTYQDLENDANFIAGDAGYIRQYKDVKMYSYDVIVPSGEESATITLKIKGYKDWHYPQIFFETIN